MRLFGIIVAIVLLAIAAAGATTAFAQFPAAMMGAGGAIKKVALSTQLINSIQMSGTSFSPGSPSGTAVGTASATMSPTAPAFGGSFSLSAAGGGDTADFTISAASGVVTTVTNNLCSSPPCSYTLNVVATQAGISNSPRSQLFTVTSSAASASVYPTTIFVADDTPANMIVTYFSMGGTLGANMPFSSSGTCNWSGTALVSATLYEFPNDPWGVAACGLQTATNLGTGNNGNYSGTISATSNGHNYSSAVTVTIGPQPTTMPPNMNDTAEAWVNGQPPQLSFGAGVPNIPIIPGGGAGGSDTPCNVTLDSRGVSQMVDYEAIPIDQTGAGGCSATNWHTGALSTGPGQGYWNTWVAAYQNGAANTYAHGWLTQLLIISEWQSTGGGAGCQGFSLWYNTSFCGGSQPLLAVSDVVATFQNFTKAIHTNFPRAVVGFQGPQPQFDGSSGESLMYWSPELANGTSSAVDMTGTNVYYYGTPGGGQTSAQGWQAYMCSQGYPVCPGGAVNQEMLFWSAALGGLPVGTNETCVASEGTGDPGGYVWPRHTWLFSQATHYMFMQIANGEFDDPDSATGCDTTVGTTDGAQYGQMVSPYTPTGKYPITLCSTSSIKYPGGGTCPGS